MGQMEGLPVTLNTPDATTKGTNPEPMLRIFDSAEDQLLLNPTASFNLLLGLMSW